MTAINNQQVNSFLKLTQINRQNIDTSKFVDNKNTLNNSVSLKSDDSKEVKYELEGDLNFDELDNIDDTRIVKQAEEKIKNIYERAEKESKTITSEIEKSLDKNEKETNELITKIEETSKKVDILISKLKKGDISDDEKKELGELCNDYSNSLVKINNYCINSNKNFIERMFSKRENFNEKYNCIFNSSEYNAIITDLSAKQGKSVGISEDASSLLDKYDTNAISNDLASKMKKFINRNNELYNKNKAYAESFKVELSGTEFFKKYFENREDLNKICEQK